MAIMKHSTKITLYNSYFDLNDNLTPKSILSIFQDVASIHAEEIGVGFKTMLEKNLYWVLSRVKFDILKMPDLNQTVVVETWPHQKGRIDFDRDFKILSENGEQLIVGTSKWCVIGTINRTLQRTENVNYVGEYCLDVNYTDKFSKIMLPTDSYENQFVHTVSFSDLDHNQHMNNTNYANLVLNATHSKTFKHFEINFVNECKLGEQIKVLTTTNQNGEYVVGLVDEKTAFVAYLK